MQKRVDIRTPDGVCDAVEVMPETKAKPWAAVILFMDAFGVRPALVNMAERLAGNGYFVLVPNLFYRAGAFAPFDAKTAFSDPAERARLTSMFAHAKPDDVMRDVGAFLDHIADHDDARTETVGVVGYCMGGQMAFRASAAYASRIAGMAAVHAGNLVTDKPDSPHLQAPHVKARCYFACADNDRSCTPEARATLDAALKAAGVRYELELYEGKLHGFAVDDTAVFDKSASERHWDRVLRLFDETLRA